MPETMDTGIEMTSAPGQPMTSSVSASSTSRNASPATTARTMMPGVYQRENFSMNVCVGAFASCASSTRWMMRASVVSAPTPVASTRRKPPREMVPANTWSPIRLSTGTDSPVMLAWSMAPVPSTTTPSTGTLAPFFTMTISPASTSAAPTVTCSPPRRTTASSGATAMSSCSADLVLFSVADSRALPTAKRKVTAAASQ